MKIVKAKFSLIPKIQKIYAGYKGLKCGLGMIWLGKMLIVVKPINER